MKAEKIHTYTVLEKKQQHLLESLEVRLGVLLSIAAGIDSRMEQIGEWIRSYEGELRRSANFTLAGNTWAYLNELYEQLEGARQDKARVDGILEQVRSEMQQEFLEKRKASTLIDKATEEQRRERTKISDKRMDELWLQGSGARSGW